MKIVYCIILLLILNSIPSRVVLAQWTRTNGPQSFAVMSLLAKGHDIFAGTSSNGVYLSNDDGMNWKSANTGLTDTTIISLAAGDNYIFAGTNGHGVFRSSDNSQSWEAANKGIAYIKIRSLLFSNGTLFAGTYDYCIFRSTDYGNSWQMSADGLTESHIYSLAAEGNKIFAGASGGRVFYSSNNGINWQERRSKDEYGSIISLALKDSILLASEDGQSGSVFRSTDYGLTWQDADSGLISHTVRSFIKVENSIFAGTYWGLYLSNNIGLNWEAVDNGLPKTQIYSLASNDRYLFAGGTINGIWRRRLSEMIDSKELPDNYLLYQNYPNPFNPGTTITYSIPKQSNVELKIYDMLGREISTLVSKEQSEGEYKVQFNASPLPSGVYIYTLQAGQFRNSKKLLLLK